ncbi:hypothetical protein C6P77_32515 [Burkholderia ambifaria]|nr:hypothetical protein C6P77_32515 [Burkholderia ambifaria]
MEEAACQQHAFPSRHQWRGFSEQILMKSARVMPARRDRLVRSSVQPCGIVSGRTYASMCGT